MRIFLKDGKEHEIPEEWIQNWEDLHYNVRAEIMLAIQWSADHVDQRKTRRGLRGFLGNWIRRKCTIKPKVSARTLPLMEKPSEPLDTRLERLAELKKALA